MTMIEDRPPIPEAPDPAPQEARVPWIGAVLLLTAVLVDLSLQTRASGVAASLAVVVLCVGLVLTGRVRRHVGRLLLVVAAGVGALFAVRSSPWLVALDLLTVCVVLGLAVTSSATPPTGTRFSGAARRIGAALQSVLVALPLATAAVLSLLPRPSDGAGRRLGALARGLLLALPLLFVVGVLLASADPVFASLFSIDVDLSGTPIHLVVVLLAIWAAAGCFVASARPPVETRPSQVTIGATEGLVVVAALTGLYAVFAASRFTAALRGPEYVLETSGMTYAEYARSGFFQLLVVAGLTAAVLVFLRSSVDLTTTSARRWFAVVSGVACALTLVVVHAAIAGLGLYADAFGLTLLRFYSSAFAWWLGAAFVLMAVAFAVGARSTREWLPTAMGVTALVAVVAVNLVNPDALVVERNLDHHLGGGDFDTTYVLTLSSDATPAIVEALPHLSPTAESYLVVRLCGSDLDTEPPEWNLSRWRAAVALDEACP